MIRATTLWDFYLRHYRPQRLLGGSKNTDKQYRIQLNHFAKFLGREATFEDLTDQTVADFLREHSSGRAAPTTNKAYWCLYALWNLAVDRKLVDERPTLRPLKEPDRIPMAWLLDEIRRLLNSCAMETGNYNGVPAGRWWVGIHWCWWSTGERCSAMLLVERDNCDLSRGELFIPAEARKGKTRDRIYRLIPPAVEALKAIWLPERKHLFPFPWCRETFYYRYNRILRRASLPTDRRSKPQRMRRSFASYLEAAGGNATEALDHSTRRVTKRSYLDPRICGGQNPAELLPSLDVPPDAV